MSLIHPSASSLDLIRWVGAGSSEYTGEFSSKFRLQASAEEVNLTPAHPPHARALEAFNHVLHEIKAAVVKSRHDWDKHEPMMWSRANRLSDHDLVGFKVEKDLVEIRTGVVSYGTLIFGKIRIPAVEDEFGAGYIHVRCVDYTVIQSIVLILFPPLLFLPRP